MRGDSIGVVPTIRRKIAEERAILAELQEQFKHPPMKNWVRRTLADLFDIDSVLSSLVADYPDDEDRAMNLHWAEVQLECAVERRQRLQAAIEMYGPDAVAMFPISSR